MNLLSFLRPSRTPRLDPSRTRQARQAFDADGKYDAWQAFCQSGAAAPAGGDGGRLDADGFEIVTLLSPEEAKSAKEACLANAKKMEAAKAEIDYADVLSFENTEFLRGVVEKMLSPEMSQKVKAVFGSEFYVHSLVVNRTMPAKASKRSFLWHCDRGPLNFLKINMFLDATEDHGGTTEFIDLGQSAAFERVGYTFGPNKERVPDLKRLGAQIGVAPQVERPELAAGQAFIFFPSRVLHRGFLPSRGVRHMMSLVLLPSPVHWSLAWDTTVRSGFHDRSMATFPESAENLFDVLELPRRAL
ncbi:hypothetical protein JOD31_003692 [Methylopila capsulata]|uniref:Uncharacterized protein n=1 Tax=Methylopila capsulata TaxID=61654 RepID=A0A9W6MTQ4_9HYPH|nr:hypothetical protein [Methylopila capsulata]MBM7853431.1 hypothetical protein [Methylopila capsulata]GLK57356.1 hypothetical protein GCM10008170_33760 [Methylopila capsulata]